MSLKIIDYLKLKLVEVNKSIRKASLMLTKRQTDSPKKRAKKKKKKKKKKERKEKKQK